MSKVVWTSPARRYRVEEWYIPSWFERLCGQREGWKFVRAYSERHLAEFRAHVRYEWGYRTRVVDSHAHDNEQPEHQGEASA